MSRQGSKLTARKVAATRAPGRYGDGLGLWLQVTETGVKSWLFRYMHRGRARAMGLGPVHTVGLADARTKAAAARKMLLDGIDPIEAGAAARARAAAADARMVTFRSCAELCIADRDPGWRNPKHRAQWRSTLETFAYPLLGDLPVADVDTGLVLKVLRPVWTAKPETASRLRGRIEAVLDWARVHGHRSGDNPARWRGHLDNILPRRSRVAPTQHFPALPYAELPAFMAALRDLDFVSARALEFLILTAARTGEVIGATLGEIDTASNVWTVPAARTKTRREHRVPLSNRALAILKGLPRDGDFVFPGARDKAPLSNMALLMTLRRLGRGDLTVHGFRSTFRDWAAERTAYPRDVVEMALAHAIGDKVEAAYRRGDLFAKRRRLMADWAKFCVSVPAAGAVVALRRERA